MSALLVVAAWYAAGFLVADRLVADGHSPVLWWTTAALLGGAVVCAAAIALLWRRRSEPRVEVVRRGRPTDGMHVAALAPPGDLAAAVAAIPDPVAARAERVTAVGLVGHEALAAGIDTGERTVAARTLRALRPFAAADDRLITSRGVDQAEAALRGVGTPDLVVVTLGPAERAIDRDLDRAVETSSRCAVPVLLVPVGPALTRTRTAVGVEAAAA